MLNYNIICNNCGADFKIKEPHINQPNYVQCNTCGKTFPQQAISEMIVLSSHYDFMMKSVNDDFKIELFQQEL